MLANQRGEGYKPGKTVVFTKYRPNTPEQYIRVHGKHIKNKTNKCLTPANFEKRNRNTLEFWICRSKPTQLWERRTKQPQKRLYGDFDKNSFALELKMPGRRRVYMSNVRTLGGYMAKIRQGVNSWRSRFIYDKRTKSLRLFKDRSIALSNQLGKGSKQHHYAVFRRYLGQRDQELTINNSRYIRNRAGNCLTPAFFKNEDRQPLTWHKCHHLNTQKFTKEFSEHHVETYKEKFDKLRAKVKATALSQSMN